MSTLDDLRKRIAPERPQMQNVAPPESKPSGDGYTFTEKEIQSMSGDFYTPKSFPYSGGTMSQGALASTGGVKIPNVADAAQVPSQPITTRSGKSPVPYMPVTDASTAAQNQVQGAGPIQTKRADGSVVDEGDTHKMTNAELIEHWLGTRPLTDEERKAEEKKRNRQSLIASIGDGISSIAKMFYIGRGAPYVASKGSMTKALQDRYDELDKKRLADNEQYLNAYMQLLQRQEAERRQKELDEYRKEQLRLLAEKQDEYAAHRRWQEQHGDEELDERKRNNAANNAVRQQNANTSAARVAKIGTGGKSGGGKYNINNDPNYEKYEYLDEETDPKTSQKKKAKVSGYRKKKGNQGGNRRPKLSDF